MAILPEHNPEQVVADLVLDINRKYGPSLDVTQVAEVLKCGLFKVRQIERKDLPVIPGGNKNKAVYLAVDLARYMVALRTFDKAATGKDEQGEHCDQAA